jgi:glycine cleavage system H protein
MQGASVMSGASEVKDDRKYTRDHEWALTQGDEVVVGITAFAVDQLGDITLVNLDVQVGAQVEAGKAFGTIESVKTLSDLFAPVSGKVTRINQALADHPELVNQDPWEAAWMIAFAPTGTEAGTLLDPAAYRQYLADQG